MIETPRLLLRPFQPHDRAAFADINTCPQVCRFLPSTLNRAQSDAAAHRIEEHFTTHGYSYYALIRKQDSRFIGFTGFMQPSFDAAFMPAVEIGWRVASDCWGQGYAPEAAAAAMHYGCMNLHLQNIVSFTVHDNHASRRVMEKIGLRHDPAGDFAHPRLPPDDRLSMHVLYRAS